MAAQVRAGTTTAELAVIGSRILSENGARSSPPLVYGFPGDVCISVNDEVVHGIPSQRALLPGDLVKLDLTAEKDGYHTDSALTIQVAPANQQAAELARCAKRAFGRALEVARAGNFVREIGQAVEREVRRRNFQVVRELGGHGIGRTIHEPPSVPNFADSFSRQRLTDGLVITIEPIIAATTGSVILDPDGWTLRTKDGSLAAHYEHTIVITKGQPFLLTAP